MIVGAPAIGTVTGAIIGGRKGKRDMENEVARNRSLDVDRGMADINRTTSSESLISPAPTPLFVRTKERGR